MWSPGKVYTVQPIKIICAGPQMVRVLNIEWQILKKPIVFCDGYDYTGYHVHH